MMALELLDAKWAGGNSAQPGSAQASVSRPENGSRPVGDVQLGDHVGCVVMHRLGADPKRLATPALSRTRGQQPQDLGLTFNELEGR
jgi:hypothetical protein